MAQWQWIVFTDIQDRLEDALWLQIFDKDRDGTVNTSSGKDKTFLDKCIATAQSMAELELMEAYPSGLEANNGTPDEAIKDAMVSIAIYTGVKFSPFANSEESSAFRKNFDDALAMFERIRKGQGLRVRTSAGGEIPQDRRQEVQNTTVENSTSEETTLPYTRVADRRDGSDF